MSLRLLITRALYASSCYSSIFFCLFNLQKFQLVLSLPFYTLASAGGRGRTHLSFCGLDNTRGRGRLISSCTGCPHSRRDPLNARSYRPQRVRTLGTKSPFGAHVRGETYYNSVVSSTKCLNAKGNLTHYNCAFGAHV